MREKAAYVFRPTKTNWFSHFFYFRDAAKHAASHATEDKKSIENGTQNTTKTHHFSLFFTSRAATLTKPSKITSRRLPGPPPREGKRLQNRPKSRQELPKMDPGRSKKYFLALSEKIRATLFRSERPPEPHLPPKTPREASRALQRAISDPPGLEIRPPGGSFFDAREFIFKSLANPFPTQVQQHCAHTFLKTHLLLHPPCHPFTRTRRQHSPPHKKGRRTARSD